MVGFALLPPNMTAEAIHIREILTTGTPPGDPGLLLASSALTLISIYPNGNHNYLLKRDRLSAPGCCPMGNLFVCHLAEGKRCFGFRSAENVSTKAEFDKFQGPC